MTRKSKKRKAAKKKRIKVALRQHAAIFLPITRMYAIDPRNGSITEYIRDEDGHW